MNASQDESQPTPSPSTQDNPAPIKAPRLRFTLSIGDYFVIIPAVIAILIPLLNLIATIRGQLTPWITSIDNRLSSVQSSVEDIKVSLAEANGKLDNLNADIQGLKDYGVVQRLPPPELSTFWFAFDPDNQPFSKYLAKQESWEGVWTDLAEKLRQDLRFSRVEFQVKPTITSSYAILELNYYAILMSNTDPLTSTLKQQGWSQRSVDPYFQAAGHGPYDYSIFLSPKIVDAGFEADILSAISKVPTELWSEWGAMIDQQRP